MLVHKFYLVECIGFEFKFEFEFKLVECCLEKRKKKNQKRRKPIKPKTPTTAGPLPPFLFFPQPNPALSPVGPFFRVLAQCRARSAQHPARPAQLLLRPRIPFLRPPALAQTTRNPRRGSLRGLSQTRTPKSPVPPFIWPHGTLRLILRPPQPPDPSRSRPANSALE